MLAGVALGDIGFVFRSTALRADNLDLTRLPDGGATLQVFCVTQAEDAGITLSETSRAIELDGGAQAAALNLLNNQGLAACRSGRPGL